MQQIEKLEYGKYYHIYNHAVGGVNLFRKAENYEFFLYLYGKHISPVADTFAWVLMPNHFHVAVRIKTKEEMLDELAAKPPHQHFSNLFNAYTKSFNNRYLRWGALFERPFKRKRIDSIEYLKQTIIYIHQNPVHHGFCKHVLEYPWSSYLSCISVKPTKLKRKKVIGWFDDTANFITRHDEKVDLSGIDDWLDI